MKPSRRLFAVVATAMGLLLILSGVPWSRLTGNRVKDFNLFGDLMPTQSPVPASAPAVAVDPELESFLAEAQAGKEAGLPAEEAPDLEPVGQPEPLAVVEEAPVDADGDVLFEYYGEAPLARFKAALSGGHARVAVLGDSFIEGDIFTQDLRRMLQDSYGGRGVGYMAVHSDFPGFRRSVTQSDEGWTMHDLRNFGSRDSIRTIAGEYGIAEAGATVSYKGLKKLEHLADWDLSRFVFMSSDSGTVTMVTDAGTVSRDVVPSGELQSVEVAGTTASLRIKTDISGLTGIGVYLDGSDGVQLDCMSIRGNSGIGHRRMNRALAAQMRSVVDYDLIILEYGINALSAEQTEYSAYTAAMVSTVKRLQSCYPNADIIIMGIADRGIKDGTEVKSMPTCAAMVKAQRDAARRTGTVFWDTRQAMGGDMAIVDWRKRHLVNADYIHMNHDGGRELATIFYRTLSKSLNE